MEKKPSKLLQEEFLLAFFLAFRPPSVLDFYYLPYRYPPKEAIQWHNEWVAEYNLIQNRIIALEYERDQDWKEYIPLPQTKGPKVWKQQTLLNMV